MNLRQIVGATLREFRKDKGLTQADVAAELGVTTSTYRDVEHGRKNVTLDNVARYAAVFHVDPLDLFQRRENNR